MCSMLSEIIDFARRYALMLNTIQDANLSEVLHELIKMHTQFCRYQETLSGSGSTIKSLIDRNRPYVHDVMKDVV